MGSVLSGQSIVLPTNTPVRPLFQRIRVQACTLETHPPAMKMDNVVSINQSKKRTLSILNSFTVM
jgi:hypothetical protein